MLHAVTLEIYYHCKKGLVMRGPFFNYITGLTDLPLAIKQAIEIDFPVDMSGEI